MAAPQGSAVDVEAMDAEAMDATQPRSPPIARRRRCIPRPSLLCTSNNAFRAPTAQHARVSPRGRCGVHGAAATLIANRQEAARMSTTTTPSGFLPRGTVQRRRSRWGSTGPRWWPGGGTRAMVAFGAGGRDDVRETSRRQHTARTARRDDTRRQRPDDATARRERHNGLSFPRRLGKRRRRKWRPALPRDATRHPLHTGSAWRYR